MRPYIVLDRDWVQVKPLRVDAIYTWRVQFCGYQPQDTVASAGVGCDNRLVTRDIPVIVPRNGGSWYKWNLYYALASGKNILWLETWNEHHESSNINHTAEFGRLYIEITRQYADTFTRGEVPPRPEPGPYAAASSVSCELSGAQGKWDGLRMIDVSGDGMWQATKAGGRQPGAHPGVSPADTCTSPSTTTSLSSRRR